MMLMINRMKLMITVKNRRNLLLVIELIKCKKMIFHWLIL